MGRCSNPEMPCRKDIRYENFGHQTPGRRHEEIAARLAERGHQSLLAPLLEAAFS